MLTICQKKSVISMEKKIKRQTLGLLGYCKISEMKIVNCILKIHGFVVVALLFGSTILFLLYFLAIYSFF